MNNLLSSRDTALQQLRPELGIDTSQALALETFQHQTLRPLLKLQHPIILRQFEAFLREHKQNFSEQGKDQRQTYISHALKTHKRLRATYFGLLSGLMTEGEYDFYLSHRSELNKRMTQMLIQRLESHWL
jgi:NAD-specific glutamate dehydrogenase